MQRWLPHEYEGLQVVGSAALPDSSSKHSNADDDRIRTEHLLAGFTCVACRNSNQKESGLLKVLHVSQEGEIVVLESRRRNTNSRILDLATGLQHSGASVHWR